MTARPRKKIIKIGHRGAMGYEPENTLLSFKRALQLKADMIEFDVHLCATGEIVVLHDRTLARTTNGKGAVAEKSLKELKALDAGKGQAIPTLEEVLSFVNKRAGVNIQIKGRSLLDPLANIIRRYVEYKGWRYQDFLISSFNKKKLFALKERLPKVRYGVFYSPKSLRYINSAKKLGAFSVHMHKRMVTVKAVEKAHAYGLKVYAWTVNTPKEIQLMKERGVDGIFSDYPDRL